MKLGYLPPNERKKILLLSDDCRMPSGIGVMSKEIIFKTAHHYNWAQLAAGLNHPEHGKVMAADEWLKNEGDVDDGYLRIYPYTGYGDPAVLRQILELEKPDAILHFTDPRYWIWLYQMEHELRQHIPILYYSIWDDLPYPKYNRPYYQSCDALFAISKQTHNIHKQVLKDVATTVLI